MDGSLGTTPASATGSADGPRLPGGNAPDSRKTERSPAKGESARHLELKRLALLWAQENGYPVAALEVSLPQCRYRADVAAYRPQRNGTIGHTVVFECKQSRADLRRDDRCGSRTMARLQSIYRRQQILEKHLRIHYPTLHTGESLFPEWDAWDFDMIEHRGYRRVVRELTALQNQLRDGRKFEKISRYACANIFYLVAPNELVREAETPLGWGLLLLQEGELVLRRKPIWYESSESARLRILQRIAAAGTRQLNRRLEIETTWWRGRDRGHLENPAAVR